MKKTKFAIPNVLLLPDVPIKTTTWDKLPIADIIDDVVLLKNGGAAVVMESSSLNFSLLSGKEQEAVVAAYAALLNSLSFPIQIIVKSQRKDITSYIKYLDESMSKVNNQKLLGLMQNYKSFIVNSVKKKNVLGKRFFIVIPFSPFELGVTKSIVTTFKGQGTLPFPKSYVIKKAKIILYPKRDHLIRQVSRFGVKLKVLNKEELIELFYSIFNQEPPAVIERSGAENEPTEQTK